MFLAAMVALHIWIEVMVESEEGRKEKLTPGNNAERIKRLTV